MNTMITIRWALGALLLAATTQALAYNFNFFGGRQGRAGVTDPSSTWDIGTSGGTLSWYFDRDQLTLTQADDDEFKAMHARIQPELDKWALWIDLDFQEAADLAAAAVKIQFETTFEGGAAVPDDGGQGAATFTTDVAGGTVNSAEIGLFPSTHWAGALDDFAFVILHEWGHILGLGDLYSADHNGATTAGGVFEGEDFIDHGLPSLDPLKTTGKGDNVMQTRGVLTLDNDEIAGAHWLWGALGADSIVTGELAPLAAGFNANQTLEHHGPNTWHYRGTSSVAAAGGGTVVTLFADGVTAARDVGPGDWMAQILADRVVFTSQTGYAGNFEFELDSTNPERYIRARIEDNTPTDFTALPMDDGRQTSPFPMVFGPSGGRDFGDAPDSYRTLLASDGPRYLEGELQRLGLRWDKEPDGQPSEDALGDDINLLGAGGPDDEDGVIFGASWVDILIDIARAGPEPYSLRAWWDINENAMFDHLSELFIDELLMLDVGQHLLHFDLAFDPRQYYSRFRLTWDPLDPDVLPYGEFVSSDLIAHGEVEDYAPVPAPASLALVALGLLAGAWRRRGAGPGGSAASA
jgi:hypothetical protein